MGEHKLASLETGSQYKIIAGAKYDRKMIEIAEGAVADGNICINEAKAIVKSANDGPGVTEIEVQTIDHILATYKTTAPGKKYLEEIGIEWKKKHAEDAEESTAKAETADEAEKEADSKKAEAEEEEKQKKEAEAAAAAAAAVEKKAEEEKKQQDDAALAKQKEEDEAAAKKKRRKEEAAAKKKKEEDEAAAKKK